MKYFSDIYKKETKTCRRQWQEKQGCAWGRCETCGVIPLLYKLETGNTIHNPEEIKELKEFVFTAEPEEV
jgi:hypothetical protein